MEALKDGSLLSSLRRATRDWTEIGTVLATPPGSWDKEEPPAVPLPMDCLIKLYEACNALVQGMAFFVAHVPRGAAWPPATMADKHWTELAVRPVRDLFFGNTFLSYMALRRRSTDVCYALSGAVLLLGTFSGSRWLCCICPPQKFVMPIRCRSRPP